ncbi:MAG: fibronectin type III domain-containing protein [Thaumarchaeota archaeon]|nr:fibronectin type III domain-containing protein [Nitrososphaerota archaeon]
MTTIGTITNSGAINNAGTINQFGIISNSGAINNSGTINNSGVISDSSGTINNSGTISNPCISASNCFIISPLNQIVNTGTIKGFVIATNTTFASSYTLTYSVKVPRANTNLGTYESISDVTITINPSSTLTIPSGITLMSPLNQIINSGTIKGVVTGDDFNTVFASPYTLSYSVTLPQGGLITINSGSTLTIPNGITITNSGPSRIINNGIIINSGIISVYDISNPGTISNSGTINNSDIFDNSKGTISNSGTINISGSMIASPLNQIVNTGIISGGVKAEGTTFASSFTLNYSATVPRGVTITINSGSTLTIPSGITLTISDSGPTPITNSEGATINNDGTITNNGIINNSNGSPYGYGSGGTITNSGTINNYQTITNLGVLTNNGAIYEFCGGSLSGTPATGNPLVTKCSYGNTQTSTVSSPSAFTVTAINISSNSVTFSWNASSGATNYYLIRSTSFNGPFSSNSPLLNNSTTTYTDTGLTPSTTYYYMVDAENSRAATESNELSVTTKASSNTSSPPVQLPSTTTSSQNSSPTATVSNSTNSQPSTSPTQAPQSNSQQSTTVQAKPSVTPNLNQSLTVTPQNQAPAQNIAPTSTNFMASAQSSSYIHLSWNAYPTTTVYNVMRSNSSQFGPFNPVAISLSNTSFNDTGLLASTTYYYNLYAVSNGNSTLIGTASATTQASLSTTTPTTTYNIPNWIKNNAKWWSQGQMGDSDFTSGIQYLIQQKIIHIPTQNQTGQGGQQVPAWVKNTAGWWASGKMSDDDFIKGIEYLVRIGIIKV